MDQKRLEANLEGIHHLLSHLHGEVTALEECYSQTLLVLRKLEGVANLDELTGLMRRRSFFQGWNALLDECRKLNETCGVLMIDIDHFKKINDTHGHPTGDEVIKRLAALLKQYESPDCVVARFGGEEFAVAIRGTEAEILGVAEFIRRGAERLHGPVIGPGGLPSSSVEWKCTLSVGMAAATGAKGPSSYNPSALLKAADDALYDAKKRGRNQVRAA
mgnify:CR=1 FL=1